MKYIFTNILGSFVFDNQFNLVEEVKFKGVKDYEDKGKTTDRLKKKYRDGRDVPEEKVEKVLNFFKEKKYFERFHAQNVELTRKGIKESVSEDQLIIQAISNVDELNRSSNMLAKRLREWYSWYLPEFSRKVEDNKKFAELMIKKNRNELMKELKIRETMGADLSKEDVEEMIALGEEVVRLYELRGKHENYLEKIMKNYCPNLMELAGVMIGAKLIELGRNLKHLAMLPASTVQLLGAEKALFRHIKTGSKSPKYGVIYQHQIIQRTKRKDQGKAARMLADKLSLCIRLDYFKGSFKAKEYRKEVEERFGK